MFEQITDRVRIACGDCVDVLAELDDGSIDAVVCDPPYGLEFMGKEWDSFKPAAQPKWDGHEHAPTLETADDTPQHRAAVRQPSTLQRCATCGGNSSGEWNRCQCERPEFRSTTWPLRAYQEWCERWAAECFRVLKPGGHLLAFGGTRTYHRLACAIEDAGFEIRDSIHWVYGVGFPKSLDVSKAIDKAAGADRTEVVGVKPGHEDFVDRTDDHAAGGRSEGWDRAWRDDPEAVQRSHMQLAPATPEAEQWNGWGTALKPSHEPIVVARKPLIGTVAANVLEYGTGALNIDGTRIGSVADVPAVHATRASDYPESYEGDGPGWGRSRGGLAGDEVHWEPKGGRWPANFVLTHDVGCVQVGERKVKTGQITQPYERENTSGFAGPMPVQASTVDHADADGMETVVAYDCVDGCPVAALDRQSGHLVSGAMSAGQPRNESLGKGGYGEGMPDLASLRGYEGDEGGASRFFATTEWDEPFRYVAKASRSEREEGLSGEFGDRLTPMAGRGQPGLKCRTCGHWKVSGSPCTCATPDFEQSTFTRPATRNTHPTVKPVELMRWLVRLVTPPDGTVCDPFLGSGTTGVAAVREGFGFVGIERDDNYLEIARARITAAHTYLAEQESLF